MGPEWVHSGSILMQLVLGTYLENPWNKRELCYPWKQFWQFAVPSSMREGTVAAHISGAVHSYEFQRLSRRLVSADTREKGSSGHCTWYYFLLETLWCGGEHISLEGRRFEWWLNDQRHVSNHLWVSVVHLWNGDQLAFPSSTYLTGLCWK